MTEEEQYRYAKDMIRAGAIEDVIKVSEHRMLGSWERSILREAARYLRERHKS